MVARRLIRLPSIDFVTLGGTAHGMGHVVRCATLASEAKRRGWRVRAFVEGQPDTRRRWSELMGGDVAQSWRRWRSAPLPSIVALDFPRDKTSWLARLRRQNVRSLVIDDPAHAAFADWTLLPALHHADSPLKDSMRPPAQPVPRLLAGPQYSILAAPHLAVTRVAPEQRTRLLLSMGGADPHHLAPQLAPLIQQAAAQLTQNAKPSAFDVVLGPAFSDPGGHEATRLREAGWTVHSSLAPEAMGRLMAHSRIAVIGFGTSLTELAYHQTPFLTVTHHEHDLAAARILEAMGIGKLLGSACQLDSEKVRRQILAALENLQWQADSASLAFHRIQGGRGVGRIFDALEDGPSLAPSPNDSTPETVRHRIMS